MIDFYHLYIALIQKDSIKKLVNIKNVQLYLINFT